MQLVYAVLALRHAYRVYLEVDMNRKEFRRHTTRYPGIGTALNVLLMVRPDQNGQEPLVARRVIRDVDGVHAREMDNAWSLRDKPTGRYEVEYGASYDDWPQVRRFPEEFVVSSEPHEATLVIFKNGGVDYLHARAPEEIGEEAQDPLAVLFENRGDVDYIVSATLGRVSLVETLFEQPVGLLDTRRSISVSVLLPTPELYGDKLVAAAQKAIEDEQEYRKTWDAFDAQQEWFDNPQRYGNDPFYDENF